MGLQLKRDIAANWTLNNPILLIGEPGFEIDTGILKIGDGATAWADLTAITGGGGGGGGLTLLQSGNSTADFLPSGNGNENPWSVCYAVSPHAIPATGYKLTFDFLAAEKIKDTGSAGLVPDFNVEGIPTLPSNGYDMWNWNSKGLMRNYRKTDGLTYMGSNELLNSVIIKATQNGIEPITPFEYIHAELFLQFVNFNAVRKLVYHGTIITKETINIQNFYEVIDYTCFYNAVMADEIITRFGFIFNFNAVADNAFERIITNGIFHTALYSY